MRYAAFFRNLNLGRPNCPTRVQLEAAFLGAGAAAAASFLSNGTVAFDMTGRRSPHSIVAAACRSMALGCGLTEPAFLRDMAYLAALVQSAPFKAVAAGSVYECCVTFLHPDAVVPADLPRASPRGDVEVVQCTATEVLSVSRKLGKSPGSPNAFMEKAMALSATTRAWNTVVRLVEKHA